MPSKDELRDTVKEADIHDWEFYDMPETVVLTPDREISIKRESEWQHLSQGWAADFPHSDHHKRAQFRALYRGTPFYQVPFASLDEGRVIVPLPQHQLVDPQQDGGAGWTVPEFDAIVGRILSEHLGQSASRLDDALDKADISIV